MSKDSADFFSSSHNKAIIELKPKDFDEYATWRLKTHKCSIVLFYCAWCPHCQNLKDVWIKLGNIAAFFNVCAFNCEKYKLHISKIREDMPEMIRGYPTIIIYEKGEPVEQHIDESQRDVNSLIKVCLRACK